MNCKEQDCQECAYRSGCGIPKNVTYKAQSYTTEVIEVFDPAVSGYQVEISKEDHALLQLNGHESVVVIVKNAEGEANVIQGEPSFVYSELAAFPEYTENYPELYCYLLELVRDEGVSPA